MYNKEEEAIRFTIKSFDGIKRHKENIDMSYHSIIVGNMLKNNNQPLDTIISGYLHDIIEDTNSTYEDIKNKFGETIANNVLLLSEDNSIKDWQERKKTFINQIKDQPEEIIIIEIADKLHNLISDYDNWLINKSIALETPTRSYELGKWFYLELQKLFNDRISNNELLDRFNTIVNIYYK